MRLACHFKLLALLLLLHPMIAIFACTFTSGCRLRLLPVRCATESDFLHRRFWLMNCECIELFRHIEVLETIVILREVTLT